MDEEVEEALGSQYVLEHPLGSGGTGTVWRGRDRVTGWPVAVKVLHERYANDPKVLARFVREGTALTDLCHPCLVAVRDMVVEGGRLALVMDYVDGEDLHRYLVRRGTLEPALAVALMAQVCEALSVVHAGGVVHRDLKPSNVLLDSSGSVPVARLTDFGIAWIADSAPVTTEASVVGTPTYLAPEVIAGRRGGPAADVYAAATTLYELLVGRAPFADGPAVAVLWRQIESTPRRVPAIPEAVWPMLKACLAKDPSQRPDATEAARALYACLPELRGLPAAPPLPVGADASATSTPVAGADDPAEADTAGPAPDAPAEAAAPSSEEPPAASAPPATVPRPTPVGGPVISAPVPEPAPMPVSAAPARWRPSRTRMVLVVAAVAAVLATVAAFALAGGSPGSGPTGAWLTAAAGATTRDAAGGHPGNPSDVTWNRGDGGYAVFNGTSSEIVTAGPVLDTTGGFTVSAWVYLTAAGGSATAVSQDAAVNSAFSLQYSATDNRWAFARVSRDADGAGGTGARSSARPALDTWVHLVGVYDAGDHALRLYVDGTPQGTATDPTPFAGSGPLAIGRGKYDGADTDWFPGGIRNVEVFDRALTTAEVKGR